MIYHCLNLPRLLNAYQVKQIFKLLILLISPLILIACSSTGTPAIQTTIQSVSYLNPNIFDQAAPVLISIYQLKSPTVFQQANFFALYNNPTTTLMSDLLDKRDIEIRPQDKQKLSLLLSPVTNYLGVLAAFRNPDKAQWRQTIAIKPNRNAKLQISVATQTINIALQ